MSPFAAWVADTVHAISGIRPQHPCGLRRKCPETERKCIVLHMDNYRTSAAREATPLPDGSFKTPERVRRYTNTLRGRFGCLVKGAKASAKTKRLEFSLTIADVMALWISQGGLCPYTGWSMTSETRSKALVSIERKNSNAGYTRKNCILVCWAANRAKGLMPSGEFFELCAAIADTQRG